MASADRAERLLQDLLENLHRLDVFKAHIAAAHLDRAIEAFCRECNLNRDSAGSE